MDAMEVEPEAHIMPLVTPRDEVRKSDGLVDGLGRRGVAQSHQSAGDGHGRYAEVKRVGIDARVANQDAVGNRRIDAAVGEEIRRPAAGAAPSVMWCAVQPGIAHPLRTRAAGSR